MSSWNDPFLKELFLSKTPLIDVRAPVEFQSGSIPHSVNLPILNNEERHLIGTCYKESGQAAAIELGHKLVSGSNKFEKVESWRAYLQKNPTAQIFCFRGGLRSQIACQWVTESGIEKSPIKGGYKKLRNYFLSLLNEAPLPELIRIGGLTGSGKTKVLKTLPHHLDLEEIAHHRGSAFGGRGEQPSQVSFENLIGLAILQTPEKLIVEDESISLGKLKIPKRFFNSMIISSMVVLKVPLEERIKIIFDDYVLEKDSDFFIHSLERISRHLGGGRTTSLSQKIEAAFAKGRTMDDHSEWITDLLVDYYDPFYQRSLNKQKGLVIFEGSAREVSEFLKHERPLPLIRD